MIFTVLGGPYNGYSAKQTITSFKTCEQSSTRKILRDSWNTAAASGTINTYARVITPFRAVNNLGDFLARTNYKGDTTGVEGDVCNPKFVSDSSDYVRFKKQMSINRVYNDASN